MKIKQRIVLALMRLYPPAWRREYGPELVDMLMTRPLGARIMNDVLWSGLRQRALALEPSTLLGSAMMLVVLAGLALNIAAPLPDGRGLTALLQQSSKTLPTVVVTPLASDLYALLLVGCGCWTHLRHRDKLSQSAIAAMKLSLIAGIPVMLAGVLMLVGVLDIVVLGPGDRPTTFHQHGFTYTYYNAQHLSPAPISVLVAPLFTLGESWIFGGIGGWIGHKISRT